MSSETITKNDLENILNEVLPQKPQDTGWQSIPYSSSTTLKDYNNDATYHPMVRRYGNVVQILGACSPNATVAGSVTLLAGLQLPVGYRPHFDINVLTQGSGVSIFAWRVDNNGAITWQRYRMNTSSTNYISSVGTTAWLPIHITYLTDDEFPTV